MYTLDVVRERSRRPEFTADVCLFGLFCLIGAPLILPLLLIFVAVDALIFLVKACPGAVSRSMTVSAPLIKKTASKVRDRRRKTALRNRQPELTPRQEYRRMLEMIDSCSLPPDEERAAKAKAKDILFQKLEESPQ
jgi:hypothetical protein